MAVLRLAAKAYSLALMHCPRAIPITPRRTYYTQEVHPEERMVPIFPGGPLYYPSPKEFSIDNYSPPKLFMIKKMRRKMKNYNKQHIAILESFGIKKSDPETVLSVVKNTHHNNIKLWEIKHLVEIIPVTFPQGEPKSLEDAYYMKLKMNGECIVRPELKGKKEEEVKYLMEQVNEESERKKLGHSYFNHYYRRQWRTPF